MADLPTNFLDDILSDSMGGKRRFKITRLDGTSEEVTIEDISKYDQVGSTFGAGDINKTNQAVNEKFDSGDVVDPMLATEPGFAADAYQTKLQFDEQNKNLIASDNLKFQFATDGEGNYGYLGADDSFVPFKKASPIFTTFHNAGNNVIQAYVDNSKLSIKKVTISTTSGALGVNGTNVVSLGNGVFDVSKATQFYLRYDWGYGNWNGSVTFE